MANPSQRPERVKLRDVATLVTALLVGGILLTGYTTFRIWQQGQDDEQHLSDAIVVLGAAQYDGAPSPVLRARLDHAIALYQARLAPTFIVTGGKLRSDRTTEASAGRSYALERGVPDSAILVEDRSSNTLESIEAVGAMLRARGLRSALFVSDRTHMLRVLRMARDQGIQAWGSPTTTSPVDASFAAQTEAIVHELGGLAVYFVGVREAASENDPVLQP